MVSIGDVVKAQRDHYQGRGRHAADAAPRGRGRQADLTPAPGTPERPLRVADHRRWPTGFYTADHLLRNARVVEVDLFDRLPTPYGLVRLGVAPDHQKIKFVTNVFDKVAANPASVSTVASNSART